MNIAVTKDFLLCCAAINYGLLLYWFFLFALAHDWSYRMIKRWFRLSVEAFDAFNCSGMTIYKLGIVLFNLVPYVALRIVG